MTLLTYPIPYDDTGHNALPYDGLLDGARIMMLWHGLFYCAFADGELLYSKYIDFGSDTCCLSSRLFGLIFLAAHFTRYCEISH